MNIFTPYELLKDSGNQLHLSISAGRKRFLFIFFRLYPLLLVALLGILWIIALKRMPIILTILLSGVTLVVSLLLFFRKIITEIMIDGEQVRIYTLEFFNKKVECTISIQDVNHIALEIYRGPRGGGAFYRLVSKNKGQTEFLVIPHLHMKRENIKAINLRLHEITGLAIRGEFGVAS